MTRKDDPSPAPPRLSSLLLDDQELMVLSIPAGPGTAGPLTVAEREVADLLLAGHSTQEIAAARGTAERTVSNQIQSIYRKVGVRSREELALRLLAGLGTPTA